ncbi:MAG: BTAD domain-containing putative transcriptional regulator [Bacillota bacterium]|nr:BTAD domain-containing putative transcriptional regulator [Bacillota bacterium]
MTAQKTPQEIPQKKPQEQTKDFYFKFLGKFAVYYGGKELKPLTGGKKVWLLIQYLAYNKDREIPFEQMLENLWPEEEYSNPVNVVKNLVYRARKVLSDLCGEDPGCIIKQNNCYRWNPEVACSSDAEDFAAGLKQAADAETREERCRLLEKTCALYEGPFAPAASLSEWAMAKERLYADLYDRNAFALSEMMLEDMRYVELIALCRLAMAMDPYNERIHCQLMKAYARENQRPQLVKHFRRLTKTLKKDLGIEPSAKTKALYEDLSKETKRTETDIRNIKKDLTEVMVAKGAYFCGYEIFKNIYKIVCREDMRNDTVSSIALVTVVSGSTGEMSAAGDRDQRRLAQLKDCIVQGLRKNDIVTYYGDRQFLVLLTSTPQQAGTATMERVIRQYKSRYQSTSLPVKCSVSALETNIEADI